MRSAAGVDRRHRHIDAGHPPAPHDNDSRFYIYRTLAGPRRERRVTELVRAVASSGPGWRWGLAAGAGPAGPEPDNGRDRVDVDRHREDRDRREPVTRGRAAVDLNDRPGGQRGAQRHAPARRDTVISQAARWTRALPGASLGTALRRTARSRASGLVWSPTARPRSVPIEVVAGRRVLAVDRPDVRGGVAGARGRLFVVVGGASRRGWRPSCCAPSRWAARRAGWGDCSAARRASGRGVLVDEPGARWVSARGLASVAPPSGRCEAR